jgi:predicted nucleic acid-binding protein
VPFFWDASGLAKRYTAEAGRETANALFALVPFHEMNSTPWGYAETYSILLRRYNNRLIDLPSFTASITALQAELIEHPDFGLISIDDETIFSSIFYLRKHNLNATDAAILTLLLEIVSETGDSSWVLVASDKRLLRAAQAEGLITLNPEEMRPEEVPAFIRKISTSEGPE